jgi:hypothetical protein
MASAFQFAYYEVFYIEPEAYGSKLLYCMLGVPLLTTVPADTLYGSISKCGAKVRASATGFCCFRKTGSDL